MHIKIISNQDQWSALVSLVKSGGAFFSLGWLKFCTREQQKMPCQFLMCDDAGHRALIAGFSQKDVLVAHLAPIDEAFNATLLWQCLNAFGFSTAYLVSDAPLSGISTRNYNMVVDLKGIESFEDYLAKKISKNARRNYYKAQKNGIIVCSGSVDEFYDCWADLAARTSLKVHYDKSSFEQLEKVSDGLATFKSFWIGGELAGSSLLLHSQNELYDFFVISKATFFRKGVPALQFGDMICQAFERGVRYVNFGPSAVWDGSYEFKRRFGAMPQNQWETLLGGSLLKKAVMLAKNRAKALREMLHTY